jgi:hypothetical protein
VGPDPVGEPVVDGTQVKVVDLDGAEVAFQDRRALKSSV